MKLARSIGIAVDHRRRNRSLESLQVLHRILPLSWRCYEARPHRMLPSWCYLRFAVGSYANSSNLAFTTVQEVSVLQKLDDRDS